MPDFPSAGRKISNKRMGKKYRGVKGKKKVVNQPPSISPSLFHLSPLIQKIGTGCNINTTRYQQHP